MLKRTFVAVAAVFVAWSIMDFILHGILLQPIYRATANLWRPMHEMKMPLMYAVTLVSAACFVLIYAFLVGRKSLPAGIAFGALFGLATGTPMGFGSYSYMPIPLVLAWCWLGGALLEAVAAGAIVGAILKS